MNSAINPFKEKPVNINKCFLNWQKIFVKPYNKKTVNPYTKARIILMNGTEFEANWFSHSFSRHCADNNLRREVALIRRQEQLQQKLLSMLKPTDETPLEEALSYEQLAVDLTATLAKHVKDKYVKQQLNFALLEDFDHLYRFSNLIESENNVEATSLIGKTTEITIGRPTISEHRHPYDDIRFAINNKKSDLFTKLTTNIITAAEQQTMNFYMNVCNTYPTEMGRKLFAEIAMIEEEHVSGYGSLIDPNCSWLENLLMHEYVECYLYYSCYLDEVDETIKEIWHNCYLIEVSHLHKVCELLEKYENKSWQDVFTCGGDFPEFIKLGENKDYVRKVLKETVNITACCEDYLPINELKDDDRFFKYNKALNKPEQSVPSKKVIVNHIKEFNTDYRFEDKPHPILELRDRKCDNSKFGREKQKSAK